MRRGIQRSGRFVSIEWRRGIQLRRSRGGAGGCCPSLRAPLPASPPPATSSPLRTSRPHVLLHIFPSPFVLQPCSFLRLASFPLPLLIDLVPETNVCYYS
uniref:Uncharacterized protein n=1 Tax=Triticum urartu TaxID=4572 RepID=A0A8R7V538_TRIUA